MLPTKKSLNKFYFTLALRANAHRQSNRKSYLLINFLLKTLNSDTESFTRVLVYSKLQEYNSRPHGYDILKIARKEAGIINRRRHDCDQDILNKWMSCVVFSYPVCRLYDVSRCIWPLLISCYWHSGLFLDASFFFVVALIFLWTTARSFPLNWNGA